MEKPLQKNGTSNGHPKEGSEDLKIGEKSNVSTGANVAKSAASAITNGLNSLKAPN